MGPRRYFSVLRNWYDAVTQLLFVATFLFWLAAYFDVTANDQQKLERKYWHALDPTLLSEGFFALATILAFGRLLLLLQFSFHLGPLQVSLGKMFKDIAKFLTIFLIVLFAFAAGLCRFYQYYEGMTQRDTWGGTTAQLSSFVSLPHTLKTLFWCIFCMSPLEAADVVIENIPGGDGTTIVNTHYFTEAVGHVCFALFMVFSVIVLLNMLIATICNTFQKVTENVDVEWTFGRTEVYLVYLLQTTLPPPLNLLPTARGLAAVGRWFSLLRAKEGGPRSRWSAGHCCFVEEGPPTEEEQRDYAAVLAQLAQRYFREQENAIDFGPTIPTASDTESLRREIKGLREALIYAVESDRSPSPGSPGSSIARGRSSLRRKYIPLPGGSSQLAENASSTLEEEISSPEGGEQGSNPNPDENWDFPTASDSDTFPRGDTSREVSNERNKSAGRDDEPNTGALPPGDRNMDSPADSSRVTFGRKVTSKREDERYSPQGGNKFASRGNERLSALEEERNADNSRPDKLADPSSAKEPYPVYGSRGYERVWFSATRDRAYLPSTHVKERSMFCMPGGGRSCHLGQGERILLPSRTSVSTRGMHPVPEEKTITSPSYKRDKFPVRCRRSTCMKRKNPGIHGDHDALPLRERFVVCTPSAERSRLPGRGDGRTVLSMFGDDPNQKNDPSAPREDRKDQYAPKEHGTLPLRVAEVVTPPIKGKEPKMVSECDDGRDTRHPRDDQRAAHFASVVGRIDDSQKSRSAAPVQGGQMKPIPSRGAERKARSLVRGEEKVSQHSPQGGSRKAWSSERAWDGPRFISDCGVTGPEKGTSQKTHDGDKYSSSAADSRERTRSSVRAGERSRRFERRTRSVVAHAARGIDHSSRSAGRRGERDGRIGRSLPASSHWMRPKVTARGSTTTTTTSPSSQAVSSEIMVVVDASSMSDANVPTSRDPRRFSPEIIPPSQDTIPPSRDAATTSPGKVHSNSPRSHSQSRGKLKCPSPKKGAICVISGAPFQQQITSPRGTRFRSPCALQYQSPIQQASKSSHQSRSRTPRKSRSRSPRHTGLRQPESESQPQPGSEALRQPRPESPHQPGPRPSRPCGTKSPRQPFCKLARQCMPKSPRQRYAGPSSHCPQTCAKKGTRSGRTCQRQSPIPAGSQSPPRTSSRKGSRQSSGNRSGTPRQSPIPSPVQLSPRQSSHKGSLLSSRNQSDTKQQSPSPTRLSPRTSSQRDQQYSSRKFDIQPVSYTQSPFILSPQPSTHRVQQYSSRKFEIQPVSYTPSVFPLSPHPSSHRDPQHSSRIQSDTKQQSSPPSPTRLSPRASLHRDQQYSSRKFEIQPVSYTPSPVSLSPRLSSLRSTQQPSLNQSDTKQQSFIPSPVSLSPRMSSHRSTQQSSLIQLDMQQVSDTPSPDPLSSHPSLHIDPQHSPGDQSGAQRPSSSPSPVPSARHASFNKAARHSSRRRWRRLSGRRSSTPSQIGEIARMTVARSVAQATAVAQAARAAKGSTVHPSFGPSDSNDADRDFL